MDGIDLVVGKGEIFGILGPNGAGKTTTLEMLEGLRKPDAGSITIAGFDVLNDLDKVRPLIGVQLQTTALFDYLTAAELIGLFANLYGTDSSPERVTTLLTMVGLEEKRESRANQLSGGQQQRLSVALGLVNQPVVAFLDEPTTGLDPGARRELWRTIQNVRESGTTVVLTTHYMEEAEVLCDRVAIMDYGKIIVLDTPDGLIRNLATSATIKADLTSPSLSHRDVIALPAVLDARITDGSLEMSSSDSQVTLVGLLDLAQRHGVVLGNLRSVQASLEDVFLEQTGRNYEPGVNTEEPEPTAKKSRFSRRSDR